LKMDCEGAEYEILLNTPRAVLDRIKAIRMEIHASPLCSKEELVAYLRSAGLAVEREFTDVKWFKRNIAS